MAHGAADAKGKGVKKLRGTCLLDEEEIANRLEPFVTKVQFLVCGDKMDKSDVEQEIITAHAHLACALEEMGPMSSKQAKKAMELIQAKKKSTDRAWKLQDAHVGLWCARMGNRLRTLRRHWTQAKVKSPTAPWVKVVLKAGGKRCAILDEDEDEDDGEDEEEEKDESEEQDDPKVQAKPEQDTKWLYKYDSEVRLPKRWLKKAKGKSFIEWGQVFCVHIFYKSIL